MKKPFNVLGLEVPLIQSEVLENNVAGDYCPVKKIIRVCRKNKKNQQKSIILHELLHAYFDRVGALDIGIDEQTEEMLCNTLTALLLDNFRLTRK